MVRLQTIDTSAAPMAPDSAAAPPPPGVGASLANSSRNLPIVSVFALMSGQLFRKGVNVFAVEHLVGALEELADAFAMQFQLEAAQTQGADHDLAVTLLGLVGRLDAGDSERRLRVAVGEQLDGRIVLPVGFGEQLDADGAGAEDDLRALDRSRARRIVLGLDGPGRETETLLN